MKAYDPALWAKQVSEIEATEEGKRFVRFLDFWTDAAEKMMAEGPIFEATGEMIKTPTQALREALPLAEKVHGVQEPVFFSQMLSCIAVYWEHRQSFWDGLTSIEKYFVKTGLEAKLAQLSHDATN